MVKLIRGYFIHNATIYESEMQINWVNNAAFLKKVANGKSYENIHVPESQWCLTIDKAMIIALKQAEWAYKTFIVSDPINAATWDPLIKEFKLGNYIIYKLNS